MATQIEFDCYYQGGAVLRNQTFCPSELGGEPLLYTETRIVEDVTGNAFPWWILLLMLGLWVAKRK